MYPVRWHFCGGFCTFPRSVASLADISIFPFCLIGKFRTRLEIWFRRIERIAVDCEIDSSVAKAHRTPSALMLELKLRPRCQAQKVKPQADLKIAATHPKPKMAA
jgi:hypothetical protein